MDKDVEAFNDYAALVYKNPKIEECNDNNYKFIRATSDIECGELLVIEHVFAARAEICHLVIENNSELFDSYHPRTTKHSDTIDKFSQASNKLSSNCFGISNGNKIINIFIHQINHSCTASCAIYVCENHEHENTNIIFMELYSVKKITKGSEITINYGPETAHKRDFDCNCGIELDERQKIFNITVSLVRALRDRHNKIVNEIIYNYLLNPISKKILLNQYLSINGIYMNKNTISGYNESGLNMINQTIHHFMGLAEEKIRNTDDNKIIEQSLNPYKISLFLKILNENIFTARHTENNT
jgi:hypothetical protein